MKAITFSLLVFVLFAFISPNEVKMHYHFHVGQSYSMSQQMTQNIKQKIMGDASINIEMANTMTLKVHSHTLTGAKVDVVYNSIRMITKSPLGDQVMDSQSTNPEENKMMKAMVNKPFSFYINKHGKIEKVENFNNLYSGFKDLEFEDPTVSKMKSAIQQSFNEKSIKALLQTAFITYPETSIAIGSTWSNVLSSGMNYPIKIENLWKLAALQGEIADLEATGNVTTTDKEKVFNANGMKAKADLNGKQTTKSKVDTKTGWPLESKASSQVNGIMTILAGGMIPFDMQVPMEISTESSFSMKKK